LGLIYVEVGRGFLRETFKKDHDLGSSPPQISLRRSHKYSPSVASNALKLGVICRKYCMPKSKMCAHDMPDSFGAWKTLLLSLELKEKELEKQIKLLSAPPKRAKKATRSKLSCVSKDQSKT
jgi:hypothetical protein